MNNAPRATPPKARDVNDTTTLRIERTFHAPAQAVFDAWTSEDVLRRWWRAAHDWETTEASVDLRVGGALRVVMRDPHKDAEYGGGGHYTEIDPPRRLAFTWFWDGNDKRQLIEIDFDEMGGVEVGKDAFELLEPKSGGAPGGIQRSDHNHAAFLP